jgi:hypothetical protein
MVHFSTADCNSVVLDYFSDLIKEILDELSLSFTTLTTYQCSANYMELNNDTLCLETCFYSSNVTLDRKRTPSCLEKNLGIAGQALNRKKIEFSNDYSASEVFDEKIRNNYIDYYISGMSAPVNNAGSPIGVLNIDSKERNAFNTKMKFILAFYSDLFSAIHQMKSIILTLNSKINKGGK